MTRPRVRLDSGAVADMLNSSEVQAALREHAEHVAGRARANAPVESGEYRDGIEVDVQAGRKRAHARVTATAPHSLAVESRTGNLMRALGG